MKVINLAGQPSAGKSTTAAGLFHLMKLEGYNVELIDEYAKQLTWSKRFETLSDQLYVLAKQNAKLRRLKGQVDFVISDSPIFLGAIYNQDNELPTLNLFIREVFNSYDNINFFINRVKPYKTIGRNQNEKEANKIADNIIRYMEFFGISFQKVNGDKYAPQNILNYVKNLRN